MSRSNPGPATVTTAVGCTREGGRGSLGALGSPPRVVHFLDQRPGRRAHARAGCDRARGPSHTCRMEGGRGRAAGGAAPTVPIRARGQRLDADPTRDQHAGRVVRSMSRSGPNGPSSRGAPQPGRRAGAASGRPGRAGARSSREPGTSARERRFRAHQSPPLRRRSTPDGWRLTPLAGKSSAPLLFQGRAAIPSIPRSPGAF
jgi:hypothetical protein